ncbi:MAG: hypothetical protein PVF96_05060 [Candidatus Bathyarchaeota archaeon]
MKGNALIIALTAVVLIILPFTFTMVETVRAFNGEYTIEMINHTVEVMYNGYVFINDTIRINGSLNDGFLLGMPHKYGQYVVQCLAFNLTQTYDVTMDVPLQDRVGFYAVEINFPEEAPPTFTVGFVLSNTLLTQDPSNMSRYTLDYPKFPSLPKKVDVCNVSIVLPEGSSPIPINETITYSQIELSAFTHLSANITYYSPEDVMQMFDVTELNHEIRVDGNGELTGTEMYFIDNKALWRLTSIRVLLPQNVSNVEASDRLGRTLSVSEVTQGENAYKVFFKTPLAAEQRYIFTLQYQFSGNQILKTSSGSLRLSISMFRHIDYYIDRASVSIVLPEGARTSTFEFNSSIEASMTSNTNRGIFHETLSIVGEGLFSLKTFEISINYEYDLLWWAFRPTLWMWALVTIGCSIIVAWKRPKTPTSREPSIITEDTVRISSEEITSFIETYERRMKALPMVKALEDRARKGKISRRRYRVQRKTLDTRISTLSRRLDDLRAKLHRTGGRYADLINQLEVAETRIKEAESNITSIEARHQRAELSLGAYRKLLAEYENRREEAIASINAVLIRLREEVQ